MSNANDLDAEKINRTKEHQEKQKLAAEERAKQEQMERESRERLKAYNGECKDGRGFHTMKDHGGGPQRPQTESVFERVDNEELKKLLDVLNENGVSSFELGDLRIQLNGRGSIQKMLEAQAAAEALLASEDKADADGKPKARVKLKQPTDEELLMNPLAGLKLP